MRLTFRGSRVLILGGSSRIGLAVHDLAREEGLDVRLGYASAAGLAAIEAHGPELRAHCVPLDLGQPQSWTGPSAVALHDADYVVDLAHGHLEELMAADVDAEAYFTTHVTRRQQLMRIVARAMLARRFGRFVYVSSAAAALPAPGQGFYSAAKRAAEAVYTSLGIELHSRGVSTACLRLGLVDGGRGHDFVTASAYRARLETRLIRVEQAASSVVYLLSDQGLAFSSTLLTQDAGLTAQKYA